MRPTQLLGTVNRDGQIIIVARGLRTLAHGTASVVLAIYLDLRGFSLAEIGLFLTAGGLGAAAWALVIGIVADALGRRRMLTLISLLAAASGTALVVAPAYPILVAFGFLGAFTAMAGSSGAIVPLEQASIATTTTPDHRTKVYAVLGIVGTTGVALGALGAGVPQILQGVFGVGEISSFQVLFAAYAALSLGVAFLYSLLSPAVEVQEVEGRWSNPFRLPSRRHIFTLASLFSVDSFGTGLVAQSLAAYFFFTRFGLDPQSLGILFFVSSILTAISMGVAVKLARSIGLVNTMVFTHLPSNVIMAVIPFVPWVWLAVALWIVRAFLSQMDVPTSQSYTMAIVGPEERAAMASAGSVARNTGTAFGPSVASVLWTAGSDTIPFVAGGLLKIAYDLTLWRLFVGVKPPEEVTR
ncbi:MAG: MFS transporter [Candidatus Tectomicrobia bacterium]|nr:MFS transporter [Candidatus Tectomicrobia bacterium]